VGDLRIDLRDPGGHAQAAGLRQRQRTHRMRAQGGGVEGDDRPVGMSDEVRPVPEQLGDQGRLGLEVAAWQGRALSKARAVRQDQLPVRRQGQLVSPSAPCADDAAVDEHDRWARAQALHLQVHEENDPAPDRRR
jgi:hypothetical protein